MGGSIFGVSVNGVQIHLQISNGTDCRIENREFSSKASIPQRNKSFSVINSDDVNYFKKIVGDRGVVQEEEKLDEANTDWMRKYKGSSKLMLQPKSTEEVGVNSSIK